MREGGGRTQWNRSQLAQSAYGVGVAVTAEAAVLGQHGRKARRTAKGTSTSEQGGAKLMPSAMSATWWPGSDELLLVIEIGDVAIAHATPSGLLHRHPDLFGFELWNADHKEAPWNEDLIVSRGRAQLCVWIRGRRWSQSPTPAAAVWKNATCCLVGVACALETGTAATKDPGETFLALLEHGKALIAQAVVVSENRNAIAAGRGAA